MDANGRPVAQTLVQSGRSFCATERECERKTESKREMLACLSVLACGICDCNSGPFASIHFRESLSI